MRTTTYRNYTVVDVSSNEIVDIICRLNFKTVEIPYLDMHSQLTSGMTIKQSNDQFNRLQLSMGKQQNQIVRPIQILVALTVLINGQPEIYEYDLTNAMPSFYGGTLNLLSIVDVNDTTLQQRIDAGDQIVFNDTDNCTITIKTQNLLQVQSSKISLSIRSTINTSITSIQQIVD